jgi:ribosome-associated translation inhibitor RaiA
VQIPLQVTFLHMEPSPALESRVRKIAARFEKFSAQIIRCHVFIEAPQRHAQQGGLFNVRIDHGAGRRDRYPAREPEGFLA